jgi:hypothetical protein
VSQCYAVGPACLWIAAVVAAQGCRALQHFWVLARQCTAGCSLCWNMCILSIHNNLACGGPFWTLLCPAQRPTSSPVVGDDLLLSSLKSPALLASRSLK